jgi:hypothetical protein
MMFNPTGELRKSFMDFGPYIFGPLQSMAGNAYCSRTILRMKLSGRCAYYPTGKRLMCLA